jgi:hypothetical protein
LVVELKEGVFFMSSELFVGSAEHSADNSLYEYGQGNLFVEVCESDDGNYYAVVTEIHSNEAKITTSFETCRLLEEAITQHLVNRFS